MSPADDAAAAAIVRRHHHSTLWLQLSHPEHGFRHPNDIVSSDDTSLQPISLFLNTLFFSAELAAATSVTATISVTLYHHRCRRRYKLLYVYDRKS